MKLIITFVIYLFFALNSSWAKSYSLKKNIDSIKEQIPHSVFYNISDHLFGNTDNCEDLRPEDCEYNNIYEYTLTQLNKNSSLYGRSRTLAKKRKIKEQHESLTAQKEWDWTQKNIHLLKVMASENESQLHHVHECAKKSLCDDKNSEDLINNTSTAWVHLQELNQQSEQLMEEVRQFEAETAEDCYNELDCLVDVDPYYHDLTHKLKTNFEEMGDLIHQNPLLASKVFQQKLNNKNSKELSYRHMIRKASQEQRDQLKKQYKVYDSYLSATDPEDQAWIMRDPSLSLNLLGLPAVDGDEFFRCRQRGRQKNVSSASTISAITSGATLLLGPVGFSRALIFLGKSGRISKWTNATLWGGVATYETFTRHDQIMNQCQKSMDQFVLAAKIDQQKKLNISASSQEHYKKYLKCKRSQNTEATTNLVIGGAGGLMAVSALPIMNALPQFTPSYFFYSIPYKLRDAINKLKLRNPMTALQKDPIKWKKITEFKKENALRDEAIITPQNAEYIMSSSSQKTQTATERMLIFLKSINDKILKDKDLVDALKNYQNKRYLLHLEKELSNAGVDPKVIKKFTDYKGAGDLDDVFNPTVRAQINKAQDEAFSKSIDDLVQKTENLDLPPIFKLLGEGKEKEVGEAIKAARITSTNAADEAHVGLRMVKYHKEAEKGKIVDLNDPKIMQELDEAAKSFDGLRKQALLKVRHNKLVTERTESGHFVFTPKYEQFLRKLGGPKRYKGDGPWAQKVNETADKAFYNKLVRAHKEAFGPPNITREDAKKILEYYHQKSAFVLNPRAISAKSIDISDAREGETIVSFDIIGAGGIGFADVGRLFAGKTLNFKSAVKLAREAELKTTKALESYYKEMSEGLENALGKKRFSELDIQFSGDDFVVKANKNSLTLSDDEVSLIHSTFSKSPKLKGNLRMTSLNVQKNSKGQLEDPKLSLVNSELAQKRFANYFPSSQMRNAKVPDVLIKRTDNNKLIFCYPKGLDSEIIKRMKEAYYHAVSFTKRGSTKPLPSDHRKCK